MSTKLDELTSEERLEEIAKILAQGFLRLQQSRKESKAVPPADDTSSQSDSTQPPAQRKPSRKRKVTRVDKLIARLVPFLEKTPNVTPKVTPEDPATTVAPAELHIDRVVKLLEEMTISELRMKFTGVTGQTTDVTNKPFLIRRIAWQLQANTYGGLSERARERAVELLRESAQLAAAVIDQDDRPAASQKQPAASKTRSHAVAVETLRSDISSIEPCPYTRNLPPPP